MLPYILKKNELWVPDQDKTLHLMMFAKISSN